MGGSRIRKNSLTRATVWVTLLALAVFAHPSHAAVDLIKAEVSSDRVDVGESFLYQVIVVGSGSLPTPTVNLPSAFQIVSGPNSNISMEFVNGRMSSTRTLTYRLRAMRQGDFTIAAPVVRDRREERSGNAVTIRVAAPGSQNGAAKPGSAPPSANRSGEQSQRRTAEREQLPPIFLEAEVSRQVVHFQEPVVLTFTLCFQPNVSTFNVNRLASTEGFWSEEWKAPNPPEIVQQYFDGQLYNTALIHRLILFPTKTGELTIGPMDITVQYRSARRSRSVFDSFFDDPFFGGGSTQQEDLVSKPIKIKVLPLPDQGKPVDFENVVGKYNLRAELDTDTARTNESITFKVTIAGEGNVGFIPAPKISFPSDLEVYEPQVREQHQAVNGKITGEKSFTYLLIPRRAGAQTIPSISFSYFDPEASAYRVRQTRPITLQVHPATGWGGVDTAIGDIPSVVETRGTDIRWIASADRGLRRQGPPLQERLVYWLAYLLPVGVVAAAFVLRRRQQQMLTQAGLIRSRKAAKRALAALSAARTHLADGEVEQGYTGLARGIIGYLADRIGVPAAQLERQRLRQELNERKVSDSSIRELFTILDQCDSARFTPQGADPVAFAELIERAERWITQVDRSLDPHRSSR